MLPLIQVVTPWITGQKLTDFDSVMLQDEFVNLENGFGESKFSYAALLSNLMLAEDWQNPPYIHVSDDNV